MQLLIVYQHKISTQAIRTTDDKIPHLQMTPFVYDRLKHSKKWAAILTKKAVGVLNIKLDWGKWLTITYRLLVISIRS